MSESSEYQEAQGALTGCGSEEANETQQNTDSEEFPNSDYIAIPKLHLG